MLEFVKYYLVSGNLFLEKCKGSFDVKQHAYKAWYLCDVVVIYFLGEECSPSTEAQTEFSACVDCYSLFFSDKKRPF